MSKILLIEPFFSGSHRQWAEGFQEHTQRHEVQILSMEGRHWKWRMHGGAVTLANQYLEMDFEPDLIIVSDMLNLTTFRALTRHKTKNIPIALYFHENQLTYPWSPKDQDVLLKRDNHYAYINYTSGLAADYLLFNSNYHLLSFFGALPSFLKQFPDFSNQETIAIMREKASVLPLGMDLQRFDRYQVKNENSEPIILWNHRWEYDKNPDEFFEILYRLDAKNLPFKIALLGQSFKRMPLIFKKAQRQLKNRIVHSGFVRDYAEYAHWLWKSDIALTTSHQDFFGGSVVEGIYCNCHPILPYRLAYPEHVPNIFHDDYFYKNFNQAAQMLENILTNKTKLKQAQIFVKKYDWELVVAKYDKVFATFIKNN